MIYSEEKLQKVKSLKLKFEKESTSYLVKGDSDEYRVRMNKKTKDLTCDCWWHANRTCANLKKYGMCSHALAVMLHRDAKKFTQHITRIEQ